MSELRECPACGSKAKRDDSLTQGVEGVARCTACSFAACLSDWNHRPKEDRLRAQNERLRTLRDDWQKLYENKNNKYEALLVAYRELKAALEEGSR